MGLYCLRALRGLWGFCVREWLGGFGACGVFAFRFLLSSSSFSLFAPAFISFPACLACLLVLCLSSLSLWVVVGFLLFVVVGSLSLRTASDTKKGRIFCVPSCGVLLVGC